MKLFLDESGNSGMDIYNVNQPVLAYGGVWLDAANQQHFRGSLTTSDDGITSKAMASSREGPCSRRMQVVRQWPTSSMN